MLKVCLTIVFWGLAFAVAAAQSGGRNDKALSLGKSQVQQRPATPSRSATSCAEFGAGFVRAEGSDTCVRIGGSIGIGVTGGSGRSGSLR